MIGRLGQYLGRKSLFHFENFVHDVANPCGPFVVVENGDYRLFTIPIRRNSQAATKNLGNEEFAIERSLFVRNDLKHPLDVPALVQH